MDEVFKDIGNKRFSSDPQKILEAAGSIGFTLVRQIALISLVLLAAEQARINQSIQEESEQVLAIQPVLGGTRQYERGDFLEDGTAEIAIYEMNSDRSNEYTATFSCTENGKLSISTESKQPRSYGTVPVKFILRDETICADRAIEPTEIQQAVDIAIQSGH